MLIIENEFDLRNAVFGIIGLDADPETGFIHDQDTGEILTLKNKYFTIDKADEKNIYIDFMFNREVTKMMFMYMCKKLETEENKYLQMQNLLYGEDRSSISVVAIFADMSDGRRNSTVYGDYFKNVNIAYVDCMAKVNEMQLDLRKVDILPDVTDKFQQGSK